VGRASRLKRERKDQPPDRRLLMTLTNEPFQPVRLYYSIPDRDSVSGRLRTLECLVEAPDEQCWQWLFQAEAASLRFGSGYEDVPKERRPIILGRIRFPTNSSMVLQTNSIARAIGAAKFFAPHLGSECAAIRCRLVNRLFAAEEGRLEELMKILDQNVTVIDPREAEAAFGREFKDVRTKEDAERVAAGGLERRLKSKEDVPSIEDFPLAPEEETPDFRHLMITLQLRLIRAMEHWRGNTDLTLTALIMRAVKQGVLAGEPFAVT
jgi:hypothetical protein